MAHRDHAQGTTAHVFSMPPWQLFERQDHANRDSVLLPDAAVSVEDGSMIGEQFAKSRRQTA